MSLVATSWTTTKVAPTRRAPLAELGESAPTSPPTGGGVGPAVGSVLPLLLLGAGLVWLFVRSSEDYRWP